MSYDDDEIDNLLSELQKNSESRSTTILTAHYVSKVNEQDLQDILPRKRGHEESQSYCDFWKLNSVYHARKRQKNNPPPHLIVPVLTTKVAPSLLSAGPITFTRLIATGHGPAKNGTEKFQKPAEHRLFHSVLKAPEVKAEDWNCMRSDYMVTAISVNHENVKKRRIFKAHGEEYGMDANYKLAVKQTGLSYPCRNLYVNYKPLVRSGKRDPIKSLHRLRSLAPNETISQWYNRNFTIVKLWSTFKPLLPALHCFKTPTEIYNLFLTILVVHGYEKRDLVWEVFHPLTRSLALEKAPVKRGHVLSKRLPWIAPQEEYSKWDYGNSVFASLQSRYFSLRQTAPFPMETNNEHLHPFEHMLNRNAAALQRDISLFAPPHANGARGAKPTLLTRNYPLVENPSCLIVDTFNKLLKHREFNLFVRLIDEYEKNGLIVNHAGKYYTITGNKIGYFICCLHDYYTYTEAPESNYMVRSSGAFRCKFCNVELVPAQDEIGYDAYGNATITSQDLIVNTKAYQNELPNPQLRQNLLLGMNDVTNFSQDINSKVVLNSTYEHLMTYYSLYAADTPLVSLQMSDFQDSQSTFLHVFSTEELHRMGFATATRDKLKETLRIYQHLYLLRKCLVQLGVLYAFISGHTGHYMNLPSVDRLITLLNLNIPIQSGVQGVQWTDSLPNTPENLLRNTYTTTCLQFKLHLGPPVLSESTSFKLNYPLTTLPGTLSAKIEFTTAVNRIVTKTHCTHAVALAGYNGLLLDASHDIVLYKTPVEVSQDDRNVPRNYIVMYRKYQENQTGYATLLAQRRVEMPARVHMSDRTGSAGPLTLAPTRFKQEPCYKRVYPQEFNMLPSPLAVPKPEDITPLKMSQLDYLLKTPLNPFFSRLDDIDAWVQPQLDRELNDHETFQMDDTELDSLIDTLSDISGTNLQKKRTGIVKELQGRRCIPETELKIRRLQMLGKELINLHAYLGSNPDAQTAPFGLQNYKPYWAEIYSYDKAQLNGLQSKKYTLPHILKLIIQIDVTFHVAKLVHHLEPHLSPDITMLQYFQKDINHDYLKFIATLFDRRLRDNNRTLVEYDRYKKWFSIIKAPRAKFNRGVAGVQPKESVSRGIVEVYQDESDESDEVYQDDESDDVHQDDEGNLENDGMGREAPQIDEEEEDECIDDPEEED
jgi:hypothetical protein